jgi:excinuclease ABC subunit B
VSRTREEIIAQSSILDIRGKKSLAYVESEELSMAADPVTDYMSKEQFEKLMSQTEKKMKDAAKDLDFIMAAQFRDELFAMKKKFKDRYGMLT